MASDTAEELERFRQQWQKEVTARSKKTSTTNKTTGPLPSEAAAPKRDAGPSFRKASRDNEEHENSTGYDDLEDKDEARKLGGAGERAHPESRPEPHSALEHYERAVERESEGSLGDSLTHYRRAYKLDAGVDRIYKNKYFPPSAFKSKPPKADPSSTTVTTSRTAQESSDGRPTSSFAQLVASFESTSIPRAEPPTDASPPLPCPISMLPSEILVYILLQVAVADVASFSRLSLVCKRLTYLVATEDQIWKRICHGSEVGFTAMQYNWICTITGRPLPSPVGDVDEVLSTDFSSLRVTVQIPPLDPFPPSSIYPTYKHMLQKRPRIRFNGCYISTVNYIRPGGNTASQSTWNTPVHIVTYYRYLRFFRDGTCASLLTTTEPVDVIHHLTKENMHTHHAGGLPSSVMNNCLHGRWKLSGDPYKTKSTSQATTNSDVCTEDTQPAEESEEEGILHIETEGADAVQPNPKYIYKMMLALKSAGRGPGVTRNNKLIWLGYWSYNKLTDDWAEFGLKNDKAFFWSRVKSYGAGEQAVSKERYWT